MSDIRSDRDVPDLGERYAVEAFLGEGSMGRVWRAYDRQLDRPVAVKLLRSTDATERMRFQREAEAQASIDHEHVCRVFDVGECNGQAFLAMHLVEGSTLLDEAPGLEVETKVGIMEQVARAVQAAHLNGVVHRDLNLRNIMVERRQDGKLHAYVMDFGIARPRGAAEEPDRPATAGSPAFMAPEQLQGPRWSSNRLTDIYALGAILYAVLGEQAPFFGATRKATEAAVLGTAPLRLGLVVPGIPADLETITEKAMNKDPDHRYASAGEIVEDLRRWRNGFPITAGAESTVGRARIWVRTHWAFVTAVAVVAALFASASVWALWCEQRTARRQALEDRYRSEVEQIDRLLRRARMMPFHDTSPAEDEVNRRLDAVEASLLEHGPLVRGPAYYALGYGRLVLREYETAEGWLRAALGSGFDDPEVETALGIAVAMQLLESPMDAGKPVRHRIDEARELLTARGPRTSDLDLFHLGLSLLIDGRLDQAIETARESSIRTPWLYEAFQLEGVALVARSGRRLDEGDQEGALADLNEAGRAYDRGLSVARSDPWLINAEIERLERLIELQEHRLGVDGSKDEIADLRAQILTLRAEGVAPGAGDRP